MKTQPTQPVFYWMLLPLI